MKVDEWTWSRVFEMSGELLSKLSGQSRELIFTLLEDFLYCDFIGLFPLIATDSSELELRAMLGRNPNRSSKLLSLVSRHYSGTYSQSRR